MAVVQELLRSEADGSISFGNHTLAQKAKLEDFAHEGDLYKVKTFATMTKLEKNGMFLYESVPGTSVNHFEDAQITLGLSDDTEYEVFFAGSSVGKMKTNLGGKLSISVELADVDEVHVKVVEA